VPKATLSYSAPYLTENRRKSSLVIFCDTVHLLAILYNIYFFISCPLADATLQNSVSDAKKCVKDTEKTDAKSLITNKFFNFAEARGSTPKESTDKLTIRMYNYQKKVI
jgi:hypothetical protein